MTFCEKLEQAIDKGTKDRQWVMEQYCINNCSLKCAHRTILKAGVHTLINGKQAYLPYDIIAK